MKRDETSKKRRDFLKFGLITGSAATAGGIGLFKVFSKANPDKPGEKVKVQTTDGKLAEVDSGTVKNCCLPGKSSEECQGVAVTNEEARTGIAGRKFVMVIDLAKCEGCAECTKACQKMHYIPSEREWIKVYKMQDGENTTPYWFPKPCFHCDNPPCTKVCPVNATFKRQDGIVLIDNERCIGCRFCMAACPYSTRYFNWFPPKQTSEMKNIKYSPEQGFPRKIGTVEKCDFCPHMIRQGKMPACVNACTKGVIYFGDENEDAVTNSDGETVGLSDLLKEKAGYRYLEDLGTKPRVYYLPPKNRRFPEPTEEEIKRKIKPVKI
jgi:Fe-S-cluster-containing dehydrogenase component